MEDLRQYQDPDTTLLADGRTVAESIRPGKGGIKGLVVRRADQFGVPLGQRPNEVAPKVIIDPGDGGDGFVVDMTQMTKQAVQQAMDRVPVTSDMDDSSRAAAIMKEFAEGKPERPQAQPEQQNLRLQQPWPVPQQQMPQQPVQQPAQAQPQRQESLFAQIDRPQQETPQYVGTPTTLVPKLKASFQSRNAPCTQDGFFHQIIRQGPNLILVYDKRAIGYPRTWPQAVDEDVAVHLEGANVLYITQTTGIEFTLDHNDICVLLIKEEHPYQPPS